MWPAYVEAHEHMFENGDVEHGAPRADGSGVRDLILAEGLEATMADTIGRCCQVLLRCVEY